MIQIATPSMGEEELNAVKECLGNNKRGDMEQVLVYLTKVHGRIKVKRKEVETEFFDKLTDDLFQKLDILYDRETKIEQAIILLKSIE